MMRAIVDSFIHPRCLPHPRNPWKMLAATAAFLIGFMMLVLFWPSYWASLIAVVVGVCIAVHPMCLLSGHRHRSGWWN